MTLSRSAFHGFQIGFKLCKALRSLLFRSPRELSNEYLVAKSDSIQRRTDPVKFVVHARSFARPPRHAEMREERCPPG